MHPRVDGPGPLSALDEVAAEWRRLPRGTPREREAAEGYYEAQVLPLLLLEVAAREHARLPRRYTGLIAAVGEDPTPAILALAAVRPERAHLVYTPQSEPALERLQAALRRPVTPYDRTRVEEPVILQAYAATRRVLAGWPQAPAAVVIGGSAQMAAGMAMAAYAAGADLAAVEAEEYWPDVGRPRPGSEYLTFPPQPFAAFGDLDEAQARAAWARGDFALAHDLYARLAATVDAARYGPNRDLAAAYAAWEALDAGAALRHMARLQAALSGAPDHPLAAHHRRLRAQAAVLAQLAPLTEAPSEPPELEVLAQGGLVSGLAFTLRRNAVLQARAGRYDVAVLLLYRTLELIAQRRLALRGVSTIDPDFSRLGLPDLAVALAERRRALLGEEQPPELPRSIGLAVGLVLLDLAGDPVAAAVDWARLRECLPVRSRSLLIHGFRRPRREAYDAHRRLLEPVLGRYCEAEGVDQQEMEKSFQFVDVG